MRGNMTTVDVPGEGEGSGKSRMRVWGEAIGGFFMDMWLITGSHNSEAAMFL